MERENYPVFGKKLMAVLIPGSLHLLAATSGAASQRPLARQTSPSPSMHHSQLREGPQ